MIVFKMTHKCSDYDAEENVEVKTSKSEALKLYKKQIKTMTDECGNNHAWCRLQKITLCSNLTQKQLIVAVMSGRGYAEKIEDLEEWSIN